MRWENFLDAMAETRLQDEYNQEVRACDIFVSLFMTKTGKFTEEEFDVALQSFKDKRKTTNLHVLQERQYFNKECKQGGSPVAWAFQDKLKELGHFHTRVRQFRAPQTSVQGPIGQAIGGGRLRNPPPAVEPLATIGTFVTVNDACLDKDGGPRN